MTQVKGTAMASLKEFIITRFGQTKYEEWLKELPADLQKIFGGNILSSVWFDMKTQFSLPTQLMCKKFFGGDVKGAFECGKMSADIGLKGIYKLFVQMGSPNFIASKAPSILPNYYKPAQLDMLTNDKGHAVVRITNMPEIDTFIEHRLAGWMVRAIEISGAKNVNIVIPTALSKGATATEYDITWK